MYLSTCANVTFTFGKNTTFEREDALTNQCLLNCRTHMILEAHVH